MHAYERWRLRMMAGLAVGESLLDVGCAQAPNPYLRGRRVVGLDLDAMAVCPPYTEHIVGDVYSLTSLLGPALFDTVLIGELIEHVERPYELLRAVREHIAPGGRLVLSTPNPLGIPVVLAEYLRLQRCFYTEQHLWLLTPRWMARMLQRSGYTVTRTIGCGASLWGLRVPAPVALSYQVIYVAEPSGEG